MTCHRVPMSPSLCTCGAVLDITQWHGDDDIGNPLCPTCSGCGCPNERNLMNEQRLTLADLERLPDNAVVLDFHDNPWVNDQNTGLMVAPDEPGITKHEFHDSYAPKRMVWPVPKPDHSMCARLVRHPDDPRNRHGLQSPNGSYLTLPHDGPAFVAPDDYWRERGYVIPEPEPTVMERAAKVLGETLGHGDEPELARALDRAGLLVKDGEQ